MPPQAPPKGGDVPGGVSWIVLGKENNGKYRLGSLYLVSEMKAILHVTRAILELK